MNDIHQQRVTAVRQQFDKWQIEALLITSPANRRWLSGFTGSNAMLLLTPDQALIATDSRYYTRAQNEAPHFTLFKHERTRQHDRQFFQAAPAQRIGIEQKHVTLEQMARWRGLRLGIRWQPLAETVEPLRAIKSAAEIALMQRAAAITDQAMAQFPHLARPGQTEKQLAWELEKVMMAAGADGVAFATSVASGPNSALPHHTTGDRPLQIGDLIIMDMGARLDGYHSDMTRTFYLGSDPPPRFWQLYRLVQQAQQTVLQQARAGMTLLKVDALARNLIHGAGHKEHFGHGLGHGVGLEIHEGPFLSPHAPKKAMLATGMNVTIEPGIYIPGWGGIRLEDFAWLTDDGWQLLSHAPQEPVIE